MKTIEEARELLEELGKLQEKGQATGLPCPRCGHDRMLQKPVQNALSRRAKVYICPECGMDEALRDMAGMEPLPLNQWGMVLSFDDKEKEEEH